MTKSKDDRDYLEEYFNLMLEIYGEIPDLEDIKQYIAVNYVNRGWVHLIRPVYSKEIFVFINEKEWNDFNRRRRKKAIRKREEIKKETDKFYLAFLLRGETEDLKAIKSYIMEKYVSTGKVELIICEYSKDKRYIVEESTWRNYTNVMKKRTVTETKKILPEGTSKAVALVVSARQHGNCYDFAEFVLDKLKAAGIKTELINFYDYQIMPCQGCNYECVQKFNPEKGVNIECPIEDDVKTIWEKVWNANILFLFIPTYAGLPPALWVAFCQRQQGILEKPPEEELENSTVCAVVLASPHWSGIGERTPSIIADEIKNMGGEIAGFEIINNAGFETENLFGKLINEVEIQRRLEFLVARALKILFSNNSIQ